MTRRNKSKVGIQSAKCSSSVDRQSPTKQQLLGTPLGLAHGWGAAAHDLVAWISALRCYIRSHHLVLNCSIDPSTATLTNRRVQRYPSHSSRPISVIPAPSFARKPPSAPFTSPAKSTLAPDLRGYCSSTSVGHTTSHDPSWGGQLSLAIANSLSTPAPVPAASQGRQGTMAPGHRRGGLGWVLHESTSSKPV